MYREPWVLFLLVMMRPDRGAATTVMPDGMKRGERAGGKMLSNTQCVSRLQETLDTMREQRRGANAVTPTSHTATLNLNGYALHKPLRTAPYDMYVMDMRLRMPSKLRWYRVDRCRYDPRNASVDAALTFRELSASGLVKLYEEGAVPQRGPIQPQPADTCNMTLRLRCASLGLTARSHAIPRAGAVHVETKARFSEPDFLSIHAYGCQLPNTAQTHGAAGPERKQAADFAQEMEDVFVRGTRSLLGAYMEQKLQQPLRDTLMTSMGYTISYGR